jgi:hypothetical protein
LVASDGAEAGTERGVKVGGGMDSEGVGNAGTAVGGVGVGANENDGVAGGGEGAGVGAKVTFLSDQLGCEAGGGTEVGVGAGIAAGTGCGG